MYWLPVSSVSLVLSTLLEYICGVTVKASKSGLGNCSCLVSICWLDRRKGVQECIWISPCHDLEEQWKFTVLKEHLVFILHWILPYSLFSKVEFVIDYLWWTLFLVFDGMKKKTTHICPLEAAAHRTRLCKVPSSPNASQSRKWNCRTPNTFPCGLVVHWRRILAHKRVKYLIPGSFTL